MTQFGKETSFYMQEELDEKISKILLERPGTFKSRSHFINCAISRELRRLKEAGPEFEVE